MQIADQIQTVRSLVEDYFDQNASNSIYDRAEVEWNRDHIINIGTSILCTKWKIGYEGGGFVQAVVDNNLTRAVSNADATNIKALKFYCQLMYNVGMPEQLWDVVK
jgi:hypothetical protein